jgi:UDP-N-acetylmuramyl pentapeptide phosphotransferase/UDP-N-acetylglucosamine-1-phosphate transferase
MPTWLTALIVTVVLVWSANLYNFMDGSDGIAGTMGVCGFTAYGIAATMAGYPAQAYFSLASATLVFLAVNVPPARTFMGDVGAVPLGLLAAAFGLGGWQTGAWPGWFPLLVFLPFLGDATLTLAKRIWRRERVWEAHRGHYYQRVHRMGAGHAGTLALFGALMLGTTGSAIATLAAHPEFGWGVFAVWSVGLGTLFLGIDYHWRHRAPVLR